MSWEYKTVKFTTSGILGGKVDTEAFDDELNSLGRGGWELATAFDTNLGHGQTREVIAVFKRQS